MSNDLNKRGPFKCKYNNHQKKKMSYSSSKRRGRVPDDDHEQHSDDEYNGNEANDPAEPTGNNEEYYEDNQEMQDDQYMHDIDNSYGAEEEEEDTIDSLREKQGLLIKECKFAEASAVQVKINSIAERKSNDQMKQYVINLMNNCENCALECNKAKRRTLREFYKREVAIRQGVTDEFAAKQNSHVKELKELEDELFVIFKERMNKKIVEYEDLITKAKTYAYRCEFQKAQELQEDANKIQEREFEARRVQFETFYKDRINQKLDKQRTELTALTQKLETSIKTLEKEKANAMAEELSTFKRKMDHEYKKVVASIKVFKYDPKQYNAMKTSAASSSGKSVASSTGSDDSLQIDPKLKPIILKDLASIYDEILSKYGISKKEEVVKPLPVTSPSRSTSRLSARKQ